MKKTALLYLTAVLAAALLLVASSFAQDPSAARDTATVPVTTVVTVLGRNFSAPPEISKDDIAVYTNNTRVNVASFERARGSKAGLQLAFLIDDDVSPTAIGSHMAEIKSFIEAQPSSTEVGIYYAQSGAARAAANFSSDHQAVARKLRLPFGRISGTSPSVYLSLKDLVDHWPRNDMRHEVVMIASGIDHLEPGLQNPYLDQTVEHVQRSGVIVNTIYAGSVRLAHAPILQQNAWRNLSRVTSDSGGQQFSQGLQTPVDFRPIFRNLNTELDNQYLLTVEMQRPSNPKGKLAPIHIKTEQRNVHLSYAPQIFAPGANAERNSGS